MYHLTRWHPIRPYSHWNNTIQCTSNAVNIRIPSQHHGGGIRKVLTKVRCSNRLFENPWSIKRPLGGVMSSLCCCKHIHNHRHVCWRRLWGCGASCCRVWAQQSSSAAIWGKTSIVDDGLYHQWWANAASPTACTREDTQQSNGGGAKRFQRLIELGSMSN